MKEKSKGFTLIEMMVVIGIIGIIAVGLSALTFWGFRLWNYTQSQVNLQDKARIAFEKIAGEIREMQISDNGSYPIDFADADTLIFYSNVDSDSNREKVKYELQNGTLYRWVKKSDTSHPPQYANFTEADKSTVVTKVVNTDIFAYYDNTYNGSSNPLSLPVVLNQVRLVKMKVLIDDNPSQPPAALEISTDVALRNLKDNL